MSEGDKTKKIQEGNWGWAEKSISNDPKSSIGNSKPTTPHERDRILNILNDPSNNPGKKK